MEKKTMGGFIAALRRAKGLTQRELAERLGVSDKAVSRWERDETAPDLSLIPALSELLGVTADELIRGERRADPDPGYPERAAARTERELQNLLRRCAGTFTVRSLAAAGVALLGIPAAAVCNAAYRAELGFYVACLFFMAAAVVEAVFLAQAFNALGADFPGEAVDACRERLARRGGWVFVLIAALTGGALPLLVLPAKTVQAHVGLSGLTWPLYGTLCGSAFLILAAGIDWIVQRRLPFCRSSPLQRARDRLKLRCAAGAALAMLATAPVHVFLATETGLYAKETVFDNYEDFVAFVSVRTEDEPVPEAGEQEQEENYTLQRIVNSAGETVCTYRKRNREVSSVSYPASETCLPIRVRTEKANRQAVETARRVGAALCLAYPLEAAAAAAGYAAARKKLKPEEGEEK